MQWKCLLKNITLTIRIRPTKYGCLAHRHSNRTPVLTYDGNPAVSMLASDNWLQSIPAHHANTVYCHTIKRLHNAFFHDSHLLHIAMTALCMALIPLWHTEMAPWQSQEWTSTIHNGVSQSIIDQPIKYWFTGTRFIAYYLQPNKKANATHGYG